jgi:hypothetical protein
MAGATTVAPTLAQTSVDAPPTTLPGGPVLPATLPLGTAAPAIDKGVTGAAPPVAVIPRAPEVAPVKAPRPARRGERGPLVWIAIVLAVAAFVLLGAVLFSHMQERGGKRNSAGAPGLPSLEATFAHEKTEPNASERPVPPSQTPIVPESIVVPAPSAPREPIAPLEPSPPPSAKKAP